MRDEGVGEGPATLQAEMMPPGQKIVFYHCQKKKEIFGVLEFGYSWTKVKSRIGQIGGVAVACKTY